MAETAGKRFNRMIHRWWLELDNACHVNPNLYRWGLYLDNACHVNPILYRWWLDLVYVGRLYQADNSKRRVRRLTHQFGTYTDAGLNAAKRQSAQNPCPIRLSAGGGGAKSAPLNTSRLFEPKFIFKICNELSVSTSYRLNVFKYNTS